MAIKYCTHNADGSGDGTSLSSPWTFAQALANLTSADVLYVCNTGTYSLAGAAKSWTNAGTADSPLKIQGADASGNSYAGSANTVTLDGTGMTTGANMFFYGATNTVRFANVRTTAARNSAHWLDTGTNLWLHDCRVDNCVGSGIGSESYSSTLHAFRTRVDHNGGWGLRVAYGASGYGRYNLHRCCIDHNTLGGVYDNLYISTYLKPFMSHCVVFRNGGVGVKVENNANSGLSIIRSCTIFGNSSHGIVFPNSTAGEFVVEDTILRSNGGYGIYTANMTDLTKYLFANLCSHNNTSGHIDINSGTLPGSGHVLENPNFTVETDGFENLTPGNTNLKKSYAYPAGGTSYFWIGAIQPQPSSGGGGGQARFGNSLIRGARA